MSRAKRKTTQIRTMIKTLANAKSDKERFDLAAKYWNELAMGYCIEHEYVIEQNGIYVEDEGKDNKYESISDFVGEAAYWLSCYFESGHCRHEEEFQDRFAFAKFIKVFKPYVDKETFDKVTRHWLGMEGLRMIQED